MATEAHEGSLPLPKLDPAPKVLIVAAPFYRTIADGLIAGAQAILDQVGAKSEVIEVPGALEVPVASFRPMRRSNSKSSFWTSKGKNSPISEMRN